MPQFAICRCQFSSKISIVSSIAYAVRTILDFGRKWGYFPYTGRLTVQNIIGYKVAAVNMLIMMEDTCSLILHLRIHSFHVLPKLNHQSISSNRQTVFFKQIHANMLSCFAEILRSNSSF